MPVFKNALKQPIANALTPCSVQQQPATQQTKRERSPMLYSSCIELLTYAMNRVFPRNSFEYMVSFTLYSLNYHKYSQHISASSHITKSHQYISHLHSIFCINLFVGKLGRSEGTVIHPTSRSGTLNGAPRLQDGIANRNNLVPQTNNMLFISIKQIFSYLLLNFG